MLEFPAFKVDYLEARGVYSSNLQYIKEQAFPTLLSGPFANMTPSQMYKYAWMNMSKEKALEAPSFADFICQRVGYEGCAFLEACGGIKKDYKKEESTLFEYERPEFQKYLTYQYVRPTGGLSKITSALETSARQLGVKMHANEKVQALSRKGNKFAVQTDHYLVSAKKLIIAVPESPLKELIGDMASEIKSNRLFMSILNQPCFRAAAIYKYPWWENATSSHNITLKPWERYVSLSTCLTQTMPYR